MKIGIIGGTGKMGEGFALRWCRNHRVMVGSRDGTRAAESAEAYAKTAADAYDTIGGRITGNGNVTVAAESDVLLLSIPYESIDSTCSDIMEFVSESCIVVSPVVPMTKTKLGFEFVPFKDNQPTAHQAIAKHMKNPSRLVSAFHVISEKKLVDLGNELDSDIFVCGDDTECVETINSLIREIEGLRPLYLGPGDLAYQAEIATPLLLNARTRNKLRAPGIKIV